MTIPILKSPHEMLLELAGIPHLASGGQPPAPQSQALGLAAQYGGILGNVDMTPDNPINVYRADPTGKYGGKDRMETMPTRLDKTTIEEYIKAMRAGQSLGIPQLSPEQLARMLLVEGRSDFGFNALNEDNKIAMQKAALLNEMGHTRVASDFAAALFDKQQAANRLNKPFQEIWNGTGRSHMTGRTGTQHNERYNQFGYAVDHPKNAELIDFINSAYNYQPPVKQDLGANEYANPAGDFVPTVEQNKRGRLFANGGTIKPFRDISKMLIQKYISGN
jgi:hypothetical protein